MDTRDKRKLPISPSAETEIFNWNPDSNDSSRGRKRSSNSGNKEEEILNWNFNSNDDYNVNTTNDSYSSDSSHSSNSSESSNSIYSDSDTFSEPSGDAFDLDNDNSFASNDNSNKKLQRNNLAKVEPKTKNKNDASTNGGNHDDVKGKGRGYMTLEEKEDRNDLSQDSSEQSVVIRISSEEEVVIQLSNGSSRVEDDEESGIELEVRSCVSETNEGIIEDKHSKLSEIIETEVKKGRSSLKSIMEDGDYKTTDEAMDQEPVKEIINDVENISLSEPKDEEVHTKNQQIELKSTNVPVIDEDEDTRLIKSEKSISVCEDHIPLLKKQTKGKPENEAVHEETKEPIANEENNTPDDHKQRNKAEATGIAKIKDNEKRNSFDVDNKPEDDQLHMNQQIQLKITDEKDIVKTEESESSKDSEDMMSLSLSGDNKALVNEHTDIQAIIDAAIDDAEDTEDTRRYTVDAKIQAIIAAAIEDTEELDEGAVGTKSLTVNESATQETKVKAENDVVEDVEVGSFKMSLSISEEAKLHIVNQTEKIAVADDVEIDEVEVARHASEHQFPNVNEETGHQRTDETLNKELEAARRAIDNISLSVVNNCDLQSEGNEFVQKISASEDDDDSSDSSIDTETLSSSTELSSRLFPGTDPEVLSHNEAHHGYKIDEGDVELTTPKRQDVNIEPNPGGASRLPRHLEQMGTPDSEFKHHGYKMNSLENNTQGDTVMSLSSPLSITLPTQDALIFTFDTEDKEVEDNHDKKISSLLDTKEKDEHKEEEEGSGENNEAEQGSMKTEGEEIARETSAKRKSEEDKADIDGNDVTNDKIGLTDVEKKIKTPHKVMKENAVFDNEFLSSLKGVDDAFAHLNGKVAGNEKMTEGNYSNNVFPSTDNVISDPGVKFRSEANIGQNDIVFKDFSELKKISVKPNKIWWVEGNDSPPFGEKTEGKGANENESSDDWFLKQFKEAERSACEMNIDALNERLQAERSSKKPPSPRKIWWKVNKEIVRKDVSMPPEARQWFFDSIHDTENIQGLSNIDKDFSEKIHSEKRNWLTEKDAKDETKLAFFRAKVEKYEKKEDDEDFSTNNDEESFEGDSETPEEDNEARANAESEAKGEDLSDTESMKEKESEKSRPKSIKDVIKETREAISNKINSDSISKEAGMGQCVPLKNNLSFVANSKDVKSTKDIIKRNTNEISKLETNLERPTQQIQNLIECVMGRSLPSRTNACSAIMRLAAKKKNALMLINASGLLRALIFVAGNELSEDNIEMSKRARLKVLAALSMLSQPKDGRREICEQDGLLNCMNNLISKEKGAVCINACRIIASLSKVEENKEKIISNEGMVRHLSVLLRSAEEKALVDDIIEGSDCGNDNQLSMCSVEKQVNAIRLNACAALLHLSKSCVGAVSSYLNINCNLVKCLSHINFSLK